MAPCRVPLQGPATPLVPDLLSCMTVAMVDGPSLKVLALQSSVGQINAILFPRNTKLCGLLILLTLGTETGLDLNVSRLNGYYSLGVGCMPSPLVVSAVNWFSAYTKPTVCA